MLELEALFLSRRLSDEEILERAFLSALRKHFPKPGEAQYVTLDTNGLIKIEKGQIWEVWAGVFGSPVTGLVIEYNIPLTPIDTHSLFYDITSNSGNWHPLTENRLDYPMGWVQTGARFDVDTTSPAPQISVSALGRGALVFGPGTILNSGDTAQLIMRRRFDQEV